MARCPHCQAPLDLRIACAACGRLVALGRELSPFELFGLEPRYDVDVQDLERRLLRGSRLVHPDFFAAEPPEIRALAEENSARLNEAFELLADDARRAEWLVASLGGPDAIAERQMPQSFLMEALDWNETLDDAKRAPAESTRALDALETTLRDRRRRTLEAVRARLVPLPARGAAQLREVRRDLNAVRYFDRALSDVESLRLARPTPR